MKSKKANLKYIGIILLFLIIIFSFFLVRNSPKNKQIRLYVDDVEMEFSDETGRPFEENNRILIPVREVSEQMGFKFEYIDTKNLITIKDGRNIISMTVDSNMAKFNDQSLKIDENEKLGVLTRASIDYLPLEFFVENLDLKVDEKHRGKDYLIKIHRKKEDSQAELKDPGGPKNYEEVPILMLHDIGQGPFSLPEEEFERLMKLIKNQGYTTIFMSNLRDYVEKGIKLPEKPIVITFDDGYESNYSKAYPILKELDMKATIYVIGHSFGRDSYKNTGKAIIPHFGEKEAREMLESGLIDIQSHSFDMHQSEQLEKNKPVRIHVGKFDKESNKDYIKAFKEDFKKENELIRNLTTRDIHSFSYPKGHYSQQAEELLYALGVKSTLTTDYGINTVVKGLPESLYGLRRINIDKDLSDGKLLELIK